MPRPPFTELDRKAVKRGFLVLSLCATHSRFWLCQRRLHAIPGSSLNTLLGEQIFRLDLTAGYRYYLVARLPALPEFHLA